MTSKATKKTAKKTTRATTAATKAKGTPKATTGAKTPKAATRAKPAAKGATKRGGSKAKTAHPQAKTPKRKGILAIAAEILSASKEPMTCKEIVEQAIDQGLWETNGQTPSATLYAAIIREIAAKGKDARFKKIDRGLFTAAGERK